MLNVFFNVHEDWKIETKTIDWRGKKNNQKMDKKNTQEVCMLISF